MGTAFLFIACHARAITIPADAAADAQDAAPDMVTIGCQKNVDCPQDQFCDFQVSCSEQGVCRARHEACVGNPICGCDGQTYQNECDRLPYGVSIAHAGTCECRGLGANCTVDIDCCQGETCQIGRCSP